jgi:hypothetical protein
MGTKKLFQRIATCHIGWRKSNYSYPILKGNANTFIMLIKFYLDLLLINKNFRAL